MNRAILLQTEATESKNAILTSFTDMALSEYNRILAEREGCKTYGLTPSLEIVAYLSKEDKENTQRRNLLGIDINAKHLAVGVVSPAGRILYQTYFGKQMWVRRKHLMERRSILQSIGAKRKLERLKTKESDFVFTNLGQTVREIIILAKRFDADIAIEKLRRFSHKGRRFNRTVMRIPFYKLKQILQARCFDNNITLNMVNPWHTSKWCSRCGAVGSRHDRANYSMFRCTACGLLVNSDRKASVAIAVKALLERSGFTNHKTLQISHRRALVMGLMKASDEAGLQVAVPSPGRWTKVRVPWQWVHYANNSSWSIASENSETIP
ncbi:MAG: IS200/IS605 family element transposase accessory protein TnpB [Thaumarchaeota archaeon]|nr:IS200/IS605 family element transposase accessory protein TnpB [Nitrososphaerota archaeon]